VECVGNLRGSHPFSGRNSVRVPNPLSSPFSGPSFWQQRQGIQSLEPGAGSQQRKVSNPLSGGG
jgi:hypothetical protein